MACRAHGRARHPRCPEDRRVARCPVRELPGARTSRGSVAPHGTAADAHRGGDLLLGQVRVIPQHDRLALPVGQVAQRGPDTVLLQRDEGVVRGARPVRGPLLQAGTDDHPVPQHGTDLSSPQLGASRREPSPHPAAAAMPRASPRRRPARLPRPPGCPAPARRPGTLATGSARRTVRVTARSALQPMSAVADGATASGVMTSAAAGVWVSAAGRGGTGMASASAFIAAITGSAAVCSFSQALNRVSPALAS